MMTSTKKFHAHDEKNEAGMGDTSSDHGDPPAVKMKRWRLSKIVEKAK